MQRGDRANDHAGGSPLATQVAPLTDRLNVEPPILNGMTSSEAKYVGLAAFALWMAIGGLVAALTGVWQLVLGFGVFGPLVTLWMASTRLASFKRNRPDGYYSQWLRIGASQRGLGRMPFVEHGSGWDLGRPWL